MARNMTLAVERIADDARFAARFRRDPSRALRRYRLGHAQVEAIKAGDAASLARHGVDVAAFAQGRRHGIRPRLRTLAMGVGAVAVVVGLQASPAAARRSRARFGMRRARVMVRGRASGRMARAGRRHFARTFEHLTGKKADLKSTATGHPVELGSAAE